MNDSVDIGIKKQIKRKIFKKNKTGICKEYFWWNSFLLFKRNNTIKMTNWWLPLSWNYKRKRRTNYGFFKYNSNYGKSNETYLL